MKRKTLWILPVLIISLIAVLPVTYATDYKVAMVEHKIIMKKEGANTFVIIAEGKVKNNGKKDVKNLIITAECVECNNGHSKWRTLHPGYKIDYLASGDKEYFEFDIAVWRSLYKAVFPPDPAGLRLKIVSFEKI